jgi:hypothetical protein
VLDLFKEKLSSLITELLNPEVPFVDQDINEV